MAESRLEALNQISQKKLLEILDQIPGEKDLIIDPLLMKPLERFTRASVLRSHGVNKIYKLEKAGVRCASKKWVYLVYADLIMAKHICDQINADLQNNGTNSYHIIFVPCELVAIQNLLEEEGIYGAVTVYKFFWELIRLDISTLSLELPSLFRMLFIDGDRSFLPSVAHSLWSLQILFGKIPVILRWGKFSSQVCKMVDILMDELSAPNKHDPDIGCLVVVDRDVDYATVLLTAVTYVSLLDDVFGIKGGTVEFDKKVTGSEVVNYQLSDEDNIYREIKNRHFSEVFSFLSIKAKELHNEYERSKKMAPQEMKEYVKTKLQEVQKMKRSLAYHIGACERIISEMGHQFEELHRFERNMLEGKSRRENFSYLEDCLTTRCFNKLTCLRLLCLMSLTQNGLTQDESSSFLKQFLHLYGYEYLNTFNNLEKLGLFVKHDIDAGDTAGKLADRVAQVLSLHTKSSTFHITAQKLNLFPEDKEDYDLKNPTDMGYIFSGAYIPVVCQLIQIIMKNEISVDDVTKLLPGMEANIKGKDIIKISPRTVLVYFVGGVTYAEISAFQLLEKLTGTRILVSGSAVINGCSLIQSAM